ncbi:MAG: ABC transporter substrate-binding protein [Anaerolineae bacterium]
MVAQNEKPSQPEPRRFARRKLLRSAAATAVLASPLFAALTACGATQTPVPAATATQAAATNTAPTSTPAPTAAAAAGTPKTGGEVHIGSIQEPASIFPYTFGLQVGTDVEYLIFDTLLRLNDTGEYEPWLATEVPTVENGGISADGLTYTLKLRPGVKWHDGEPLRAADVRFTWQTVIDPAFQASSDIQWKNVADIAAPDDATVVISLKQPDGSFTYHLSGSFILPSHLLEGQDIAKSPYYRSPVGTGPFKFAEWQSGTAIRVVKNPDYWRSGQPYLDAVVYETIPSTEGLLSKLQRQELHLRLSMNNQDQDTARGFEGYTVAKTPSFSYWNFRFNCEDAILSDARVRRALSHATNKEELAASIMKGQLQPLWTYITEPHWAHNPDVIRYEFDVEKAKQLLDEAGWLDPGAGATREKDGQKLAIRISNIAGDTERLQLVQVVQQYWKAIGVETEIDAIQAAAFGQLMEEPYQIVYNFVGHDFEASSSYWLREPRNWPRYTNEEAFDLMRQANGILDRDERKPLHLKWQELLAADQPELTLFSRVYFDAVHNSLQNYKPNPQGQQTWNANEWWLA